MSLKFPLRARHLYSAFAALVILTCFVLGQVSGFDNGTGDANDNCVGCHSDGGNGVLSLSSGSDTYEAGTKGIVVTAMVNMDSCDSDASLPGVMLLTGNGDIITDAGWVILSDPNDNAAPLNYNEMSGVSGDTEFQWTLRAPETVGDHTLMARLIYDDGGAKFIDTEAISLTLTVPTSGSVDGDVSEERPDPTPKALTLGIIVGIVAVITITILKRR